jgi:DNA-directed RNA polymerase subunit RPC12/RpoP
MAVFRWRCPVCSKKLKAFAGWEGRRARCPRCGDHILLVFPRHAGRRASWWRRAWALLAWLAG